MAFDLGEAIRDVRVKAAGASSVVRANLTQTTNPVRLSTLRNIVRDIRSVRTSAQALVSAANAANEGDLSTFVFANPATWGAVDTAAQSAGWYGLSGLVNTLSVLDAQITDVRTAITTWLGRPQTAQLVTLAGTGELADRDIPLSEIADVVTAMDAMDATLIQLSG